MNESPWLKEKDASHELGVAEETLRLWKEIGYLKEGTHWRIASVDNLFSEKKEIIYHVRWGNEIIDYWRKEDAPIST